MWPKKQRGYSHEEWDMYINEEFKELNISARVEYRENLNNNTSPHTWFIFESKEDLNLYRVMGEVPEGPHLVFKVE